MADIFLSAVLPVLFEKLTSPELLKFATREGVRSKLNKLRKTFELINALLIDAEEKQLTNGAVKMWLEELQELAYDAEDILDEYATEALRRKLKIEEHQASTSRAQKLIPACCIGFAPSKLWFDFSLHSKIDDITSRLEYLCKQRTELGLVEIAGTKSSPLPLLRQRLPSTSLPTETVVYGRDEDKANILELVLKYEPGDANFGVISIVGMGGLGKTTLARQVYNDKKVDHFNPKAWVCVSDDFDVLRISKAILESITSSSCDIKEFNVVQNRLKDALNGKQFLIVLDDVWNTKYDLWENLKAPFMTGAAGSKIIVTTRSIAVASIMRSHERYDLKHLSDDDCWLMFMEHAFNSRGTNAHWNLVAIREKVVQKCKGLPLAAKTLGGLLYYKETEDQWMDILNSKMWDIKEGDILPVLRLSYFHLPSYLKRCFAYCAIFPKDHEFEEKELIFLWMAEGLIQQSSYNKHLEELGSEYFHDLLSRSLFQISSLDSSKFLMHDLVNDLALLVSEKLSFRLEDESNSNTRLSFNAEITRYASHICQEFIGKRKFEVFNDAKNIRTYLSVSPTYNYVHGATTYVSNTVVSDLLLRFKKLRVLSLKNYSIVELPSSIEGLRLLRYLNLSNTGIKSLPEAVNSMCNLQTLILRNCYRLLKWPYNMGNLINLRHLDIFGAFSIERMPMGVKNWEHLRTLSNFVVSKDLGSSLKDLKHLKFLCGELHISKLENVIVLKNSIEFVLSDKKDLKVLLLEWGSRFDESQDEEVDEKVQVLDMLRPHQNLEKLTIQRYGGTKFSSWVGDSSFFKMTVLKLKYCENCTSLPSLGLLGSLKSLTIEGMNEITSIGSEFYGESCSKPFISLETLSFENLENWGSWNPVKENESFPKLQELYIANCPKLSERLPNNLPSLKKLVIRECEQLAVPLSNIPTLCELELDNCKKIVCSSSADYRSLESMSLSNISDFGDWSRQEFKKIRSLTIKGCKELIEMWQSEILLEKPHQGLHSLISLKELVFEDCNTLTTLLEGIKQKNTLVEAMRVERCNSLNFIFRGQLPHSLKELNIRNCEKLQCILDDNELLNDNEITCTSLCSTMTHFLKKFPFPTVLLPKEKINANTSHLESLYIDGCPSLTCLPSIDQLSSTLTGLTISNCSNLTTLSLTGHLPVALKHLQIDDCSELTTLLPKGHLPETLETLNITLCQKLESIVDKFHNNKSLYELYISGCNNLKSLPEGLETLSSLRSIQMYSCGSFASFPKGGFPDSNLRVELSGCEEVEALPSGIHTLASLEIQSCPNMALSEEGLPTKLTVLSVGGLKQYKVLRERGFHNFTSLVELDIYGGPDEECFQEDDMRITLPHTLTQLSIGEFPKLKDFQDLPSLTKLKIISCPELTALPSLPFPSLTNLMILYCPELTSLPSLPSSLLQLYIRDCPLLKEACKRDKGKEWSKIADIPCVEIDFKFIYDPAEEA